METVAHPIGHAIEHRFSHHPKFRYVAYNVYRGINMLKERYPRTFGVPVSLDESIAARLASKAVGEILVFSVGKNDFATAMHVNLTFSPNSGSRCCA